MFKSIFGSKSNEASGTATMVPPAENLAPAPTTSVETPLVETQPVEIQPVETSVVSEEKVVVVVPERKEGLSDSTIKAKPPSPRFYSPLSSCEIVAVVNQKGGCGKTITTINLAASLAKKGQRVLIVDMDPQAHSTLGLSIRPAEGAKTIYEVLMEQGTGTAEAIHPTKIDKLHIIPGHHRLTSAQVDLLNWNDRDQVLRTKLLPCLSAYQCILIDCPPSLSILTLNALVAANRLVVPIQTHYFALDGMKQLFSTVSQVKEKFNPSLKVLGILMTMVDARTNICKEMMTAIRDYFKEDVFQASIKMSVKFIESSLYGEPVLSYAPQSTGAMNYLELADEVLERLGAAVFETTS